MQRGQEAVVKIDCKVFVAWISLVGRECNGVEEVLHGGGKDVQDGGLALQVRQAHVGAELEKPADDLLRPKHCRVVEPRVSLPVLKMNSKHIEAIYKSANLEIDNSSFILLVLPTLQYFKNVFKTGSEVRLVSEVKALERLTHHFEEDISPGQSVHIFEPDIRMVKQKGQHLWSSCLCC